eukprot:2394015-Amphidinium_carterae.2
MQTFKSEDVTCGGSSHIPHLALNRIDMQTTTQNRQLVTKYWDTKEFKSASSTTLHRPNEGETQPLRAFWTL